MRRIVGFGTTGINPESQGESILWTAVVGLVSVGLIWAYDKWIHQNSARENTARPCTPGREVSAH